MLRYTYGLRFHTKEKNVAPETPPVEYYWFTEIRRVVGNWWLVGQLAYWLNSKCGTQKIQSKYTSHGLQSLSGKINVPIMSTLIA